MRRQRVKALAAAVVGALVAAGPATLATAVAPAQAPAPPQPPIGTATLPSVHAAFAPLASDDPPALTWLRHQVLATRAEWPKGQSAAAAFALHLEGDRLRFGAGLPLPPGVAVAGEIEDNGQNIRFACTDDGRETWEVEAGLVPPSVADLIEALQVQVDGAPRSVDLPTLVGNLAGAAVEGDETAAQLVLGATQCGEVTFAVRRDREHLRVRGRSGGGLLVPAVLLWWARHRDASHAWSERPAQWRLRAFGSRDGDRAEAARQLQRDGHAAVAALRVLLHADEPTRLAAIDGLVRLHAAGELPQIVAAADPAMPLAVTMARYAVRELWPLACAATRTATRTALRDSEALDEHLLAAAEAETGAPDHRYRWLGVSTMLFTGLFGLWLRERARRH